MDGTITVREHLELMIKHEKEIRIMEKVNGDQALKLQAAEYERRLEDLNHAHEQAIEAQMQTVPREVYNKYVESQTAKITAIERQQALIAGGLAVLVFLARLIPIGTLGGN